MKGKDAQVEFVNYKTTQVLTADWDLIVDNTGNPDTDKWDGILKIENEPNLKSINLIKNLVDELIIINCPKLEEIDIGGNEFVKVDVSKMQVDTSSGKAVANSLKRFYANNNKTLTDINLENCKNLERINLNDCGEIKTLKGGMDFSESLHVINYQDTTGLQFGGSTELKEWKGAKEAVDAILGGGNLPKKPDGTVDVDAAKGQLITESSKDPSSPAKNELDAIKAELGLAISATKDQIIAEIKRLKGPDYISKVSLTSDAKNSLSNLGFSEADINKELSAAASARDVEVSRNKLVSGRFNELQRKLHNAHYLNIGLGTLSVVILVILTWMILKDRKLLPGQEDEEVKE